MFALCKIFSVFFCANLHFNDSDTLPQKIASGLQDWSSKNPIEKVFLHTDKTTYLAGEKIWYKAYIMLDGEPSILSKIAYVDLVDKNGKVIYKQMRPVSNGTTSGDFFIPKEVPTGSYSINAYSLWMLNYQPFVFKKNINIYNYDFKSTGNLTRSTDFSVSFLPEGGDLVEGLKSTVAFYAVNKQGIPLDVKVSIKDQAEKSIASISSTHPGYGKFEITPIANEILTATVSANGIEKKFKLPTPKREGVTLRINNANPKMAFVKVDRNVLNNSTFNKVTVVAQIGGKLAYIGRVNFSENETGMAIPKKDLPTGVMQVTVFDTLSNPLAERLVFINNLELTDIDLIKDTVSLETRGKNKLRFDLSKFSSPSVSVAVSDAEISTKARQEENILSHLFLTSDIIGYVHNPGYYLQDKSAPVSEHLDLLMLTHGWRRFKWEDVINKRDIALKYPIESGISVSGKVTVPQSTKTVAGGHVDIITKGEDSTTILSKAIVNSKGEFLINDLNFKHAATVYLQGAKTSNQGAKVDVIVNKSFIDTLKSSPNSPVVNLASVMTSDNQNTKLAILIEQETSNNKVAMLSEVKVTTKRVSRLDSLNTNYASDLFRMGKSLEIASTHYLNVWQFLREQVAGLVVEGTPLDPNVYFSRFQGLQSAMITQEEEGTNQLGATETNGITYYLNEINVSKDVINTIHPTDIALVKVFKGPEGAILGTNEGGIAIYTKKGTTSTTRPGEKGFFVEKKLGYSVAREFFSPDYSGTFDKGIADKRTTLYWNGNLEVDKTGMATVRFFNNDMSKKLKITIQGIDKTGNMIYKEQVIE